jgi:ABC-type lipoprotein release transport system permease subunit
VSGICLPILLLLGLKNGNIAEMRRKFETSPSGRQITFGTGRNGKLLTIEKLNDLQKHINENMPLIEIMLPDSYRQVALSNGKNKADSVTLYSTVPGDPLLKYYHIELPEYTEKMPEIAISQPLAEKLGVKDGDEVTLHVERNTDNEKLRNAQTKIKIACIIAARDAEKTANESEAKIEKDKDDLIGYAPFGLLQDIERYTKGQQVLRYGWLSSDPPPRESYAGYLMFTKKEQPLKKGDIEELQYRNFQVIEVVDKNLKTLNGYLQDKAADELFVYHLFYAGSEKQDWGDLTFAAADVAQDTSVDDAVIPWNNPMKMDVDKQDRTVTGITLPDVWIKQYIKEPQYKFWTDEDAPYQIQLCSLGSNEGNAVKVKSGNETVVLKIRHADKSAEKKEPDKIITENINFANYLPSPYKELFRDFYNTLFNVADTKLMPLASPVKPVETTVFVPAKMLAYFYAYKNGRAAFDANRNEFIQVPSEPNYTEFRAYAYTIDEVNEAAEALRHNGYLPMSNEAQIDEIHQQNASLGLLVVIVGLGVFAFGVLTVVSVLYDSTERKRGTIGILRVMGVSRFGVFYFICLRSALIGVLSVGFTLLAGHGLAILLMSEVVSKMFGSVSLIFGVNDLIIISIGALFCCCIGSLLPAAIASNMDPFDAISESRFK